MTDDNDNYIFIGNVTKPERKQQEQIKKKRSTYSAVSAASVKHIIDRLLQTPDDVFIPIKDSGYSMRTLYCKINDALKWFVDNSKDQEYLDYCLLRTQISVREINNKDNPGVLIYFKSGMRKMRKNSVKYSTTDTSRWRNDVVRWLQQAKDGEMFDSGDFEEALTDEDQVWLINNIEKLAPDAEHILRDKGFRIIR
jgi:hypothetical protein